MPQPPPPPRPPTAQADGPGGIRRKGYRKLNPASMINFLLETPSRVASTRSSKSSTETPVKKQLAVTAAVEAAKEESMDEFDSDAATGKDDCTRTRQVRFQSMKQQQDEHTKPTHKGQHRKTETTDGGRNTANRKSPTSRITGDEAAIKHNHTNQKITNETSSETGKDKRNKVTSIIHRAMKQTTNTNTPTTSQTDGKHHDKNTKQHHSLRRQTSRGQEENKTRKEATKDTTTSRNKCRRTRTHTPGHEQGRRMKNHTKQKNFFFNASKDNFFFF
jgi:hypothetical protein